MVLFTKKINLIGLLKIAFIILIFANSYQSFAQVSKQAGTNKEIISGKILTQNGAPVPYASISIKDTQIGASTDDEGAFRFSAPTGSFTLVVSSVGFVKQEKKVNIVSGTSLNLNFKMKETSKKLDDVLVEGTNPTELVAPKSATALKSNTSLMDTPAPVVIISNEILSQQANTTLQETIRNVSGVTQAGNNYGIGDNLIIRGLGANYAYDGMYGGGGLSNNYNPVRTLTNIDRIEVLKGPATGLYGIGSAGGVINMIEKKPLDVQQANLEFQVGSWDHYRAMVDITGPITEKTSYRLIGAKESEDGYRGLSSARNELHASLRHAFSEKSQFTLSASYIDDENQIDPIGDPVRILNKESLTNPDAGYGWENLINDFDEDGDGISGIQLTDAQRQQLANSITDTDGLEPYDLGDGNLISPISTPNEGNEFRVKLRHDWNLFKNTNLTQQLQYRTYESDFTRQTGAYNYVYWNRNGEINAEPRAPLVIDNTIYPFAARRQEYRHQEAKESAIQYFADLQNTWKSGRISGEHLLSFNYERRDAEVKSWSIWDADGTSEGNTPVPYILDIREPNWPSGSFWDYTPSLRTNYDKAVQSYGVGLQEIVYFDEKLTGRIGGAFSNVTQTYQSKATDRNDNTATPEADTDDSGFSYNLGLNYRIIDEISAFVNYATGRTAYSILGSVTGEDDRPDSESKSFDLGLRFNAFQNKLYASVVYFQTSRTNIRYSNLLYNDNTGDADYNINVPQYFYDEEDRSTGVEFDVNLLINKHWSMNANATLQEAINIQGDEESEQAKGVPEQYARMWGEYKIHLNKLERPIKINLGVRYESQRTVNETGFGLPDAYLPSYVVWDAGASFDFKNWNVRVNVENLLNERYYQKALFLGGLPGEKRNVNMTLRYTL